MEVDILSRVKGAQCVFTVTSPNGSPCLDLFVQQSKLTCEGEEHQNVPCILVLSSAVDVWYPITHPLVLSAVVCRVFVAYRTRSYMTAERGVGQT
jgi:hypothetical protein